MTIARPTKGRIAVTKTMLADPEREWPKAELAAGSGVKASDMYWLMRSLNNDGLIEIRREKIAGRDRVYYRLTIAGVDWITALVTPGG